MADDDRYMPLDMQVGPVPLDLLSTHTGMQVFEMMLAGELPPPPIARTLNFTLTEAEEGRVVFTGYPLLDFYNPSGTIHGGWPAAILDSALGCCVHTRLQPGMAYTTIEFKVNLVRPIFADTGKVVCEGRLIHLGRTIATSEAELRTADGKLLAHGTETCAIFPLGSKG